MALICMCVYLTEENGKIEALKGTLESLSKTVDWTKHRIFIVDNSPSNLADELLIDFMKNHPCTLSKHKQNLGTARGINLGLKERQPDEVCVKCDDDWSTDVVGWVDKLEETIAEHPEIGICGLKRDDVYGDFVKESNLWYTDDIFGTCTAYNPKMLDKVGFLYQPSQYYGFDDCLISARSIAAGFKNCFRVDIPIVNLDTNPTPYTEWKKKEAAFYLQETGKMCDMIKQGKLPFYYGGE